MENRLDGEFARNEKMAQQLEEEFKTGLAFKLENIELDAKVKKLTVDCTLADAGKMEAQLDRQIMKIDLNAAKLALETATEKNATLESQATTQEEELIFLRKQSLDHLASLPADDTSSRPIMVDMSTSTDDLVSTDHTESKSAGEVEELPAPSSQGRSFAASPNMASFLRRWFAMMTILFVICCMDDWYGNLPSTSPSGVDIYLDVSQGQGTFSLAGGPLATQLKGLMEPMCVDEVTCGLGDNVLVPKKVLSVDGLARLQAVMEPECGRYQNIGPDTEIPEDAELADDCGLNLLCVIGNLWRSLREMLN
ncbi:hypothetical protein BJ875DRAFT_455436 [Amylocarpus encephaloides]|uniref:Uncharacterized protein n=1 Tax=Amylocarpus encephaloides TaxID=45428 RepID=A0A9P7YN14_9HELO|nr:hypothetical protein BJ875DRAFT_455436 [Amylocarpus encephaloides]